MRRGALRHRELYSRSLKLSCSRLLPFGARTEAMPRELWRAWRLDAEDSFHTRWSQGSGSEVEGIGVIGRLDGVWTAVDTEPIGASVFGEL
jgi:hypothetical protein